MPKTFEFTLKFALPDASADAGEYVSKLEMGGCDDALIGIGQVGRIAMNFDREADSAFDAVSSAILDVKDVIPEARLIEAVPDLVGLTDVADIVGCSRQYMRKLMLNSNGNFPMPLHEGKSAIWHLSSILHWLESNRKYSVADSLFEVAKINMQLNIARDMSAIDLGAQEQFYALVS